MEAQRGTEKDVEAEAESWTKKITEKLNFRLVPQHNNTTNKVSEVEDPAV